MPRKLTLDDYVGAILDRDEGVPYTHVLDRYDITPNQFCGAVRRKIGDLIQATSGEVRHTLEAISKDAVRERELFNMGEEFIREQYDRVRAGIQAYLYRGTLQHPENIEHLVYYALISDNPQLESTDRKEVIQAIKNLSKNLRNYFWSLGLNGLMIALPKGKQSSPLAVLEIFDRVYQRKNKDASLFDLPKKEHLHEWGDNFQAPNSYWQNPANVEKAIYHILTEHNPQLTSNNREEVIKAITDLPINLQDYLHNLGLAGLMHEAFGKGKKSSPLAVLEVFDRVHMRKTGDASLFDLTQRKHLHKWDIAGHAPNVYWKNPVNVEETIYHLMTEDNPQLASAKREEVIREIKNLPGNLKHYFEGLGLSGLIASAFEKRESPMDVLKVFDKVYQRETGNPSLFDKTQSDYLEFDGRNRLIRK